MVGGCRGYVVGGCRGYVVGGCGGYVVGGCRGYAAGGGREYVVLDIAKLKLTHLCLVEQKLGLSLAKRFIVTVFDSIVSLIRI